MKEQLEIIENLKKYFDAETIGSFVLVENKLIGINEINDIDVQIPKDKLDNVYKYLEDLGYKQTIKKGKQIGYKNGRVILEKLPQGDFKKERCFKIDVIEKTKEVFSIPVIIAEKFKRGNKSDFNQILSICAKKNGLDLKKLLHHKDTTIGLYAIDKNPKDVDYNWILNN